MIGIRTTILNSSQIGTGTVPQDHEINLFATNFLEAGVLPHPNRLPNLITENSPKSLGVIIKKQSYLVEVDRPQNVGSYDKFKILVHITAEDVLIIPPNSSGGDKKGAVIIRTKLASIINGAVNSNDGTQESSVEYIEGLSGTALTDQQIQDEIGSDFFLRLVDLNVADGQTEIETADITEITKETSSSKFMDLVSDQTADGVKTFAKSPKSLDTRDGAILGNNEVLNKGQISQLSAVSEQFNPRWVITNEAEPFTISTQIGTFSWTGDLKVHKVLVSQKGQTLPLVSNIIANGSNQDVVIPIVENLQEDVLYQVIYVEYEGKKRRIKVDNIDQNIVFTGLENSYELISSSSQSLCGYSTNQDNLFFNFEQSLIRSSLGQCVPVSDNLVLDSVSNSLNPFVRVLEKNGNISVKKSILISDLGFTSSSAFFSIIKMSDTEFVILMEKTPTSYEVGAFTFDENLLELNLVGNISTVAISGITAIDDVKKSCRLTNTKIAVLADSAKGAVMVFDGTNWAQEGNTGTITNPNIDNTINLRDNTIALVDSISRIWRYTWDGSDWSSAVTDSTYNDINSLIYLEEDTFLTRQKLIGDTSRILKFNGTTYDVIDSDISEGVYLQNTGSICAFSSLNNENQTEKIISKTNLNLELGNHLSFEVSLPGHLGEPLARLYFFDNVNFKSMEQLNSTGFENANVSLSITPIISSNSNIITVNPITLDLVSINIGETNAPQIIKKS